MAKDKADEPAEKAPEMSDRDRLNEAAFLAEALRRTGVRSEAKMRSIVERLREKGDFKDDEGTWTLDVSGYPTVIRESKG